MLSPPEQRLTAVVMDMRDRIVAATGAGGNATVVFDRYHVVQHLNHAADLVRRAEPAQRRGGSDGQLARTRYVWLKWASRRRGADAQLIARYQRAGLKVGRAWAIKEATARLWTYSSLTRARKFFGRSYGWAIRSRLAPVIRVAHIGETVSGRNPGLRAPPGYQRDDRGAQREDARDRVSRPKVSRRQELPPRDPLPLRWTQDELTLVSEESTIGTLLHTVRYFSSIGLPMTSQLYSSSAVRRPLTPSRTLSSGSDTMVATASANPSGVSRIRRFSPSRASSPSHPRGVLTTAQPMAHDVVIFSLVPPPTRRGTKIHAARARYGLTSCT